MRLLIFTLIAIIIIATSCENQEHYKEIKPVVVDLADKVNSRELDSTYHHDEPLFMAISAMISPKETFKQYQMLLDYISKKIGRRIVLKQRKTYQEINDMLKLGMLDFAFICTGAYINAKDEFPIKLLSVPVVNNEPFYRAYVIVNANDQINQLNELKGKTFAYTDPLSNTGHSYFRNYLTSIGENPEGYFKKTIFTYAHDYSIQAVSKGIVDGATIDGLIYDYFQKFFPERVEGIKIIHKSQKFGIPPFVYSGSAEIGIAKQIQNIMTEMHLDDEGRTILNNILIDKFALGEDSNYQRQVN